MGFKPQGMPSAFARQSNNGQQRKKVIDKLVTIESYDLGAQQINCIGEDGAKLMVKIRPETIARNLTRAREKTGAPQIQAPKWEGYNIDSRMAESLPATHKVVIERAEVARTLQTNGATATIMMSDRILNVADSHPDKTFEGLFSISTYQNHVFHVQRWEEKGILISDAAEIERICNKLDEGSVAFQNKELRPHTAVQFRLVVPGATKEEDYTVMDISPVFDWISRQFDGNNQEISAGRPVDSQRFKELLFGADGYVEAYLNPKFPESQYPGRFIEVTVNVNYRAGPRSRYMAIPDKSFDPMFRLANTQTKLAIDDQEFTQGKNIAVRGVLQLSADKPNPTTRSYETRNIAVRLHANGPMGHVHAWIRAHDGHKCKPHEALRQVAVQKANPGEKVSTYVNQNQGSSNQGHSAAAPSNTYSAPANQGAPAYPAPAGFPPAVEPSAMDSRSAFDDDWGMDDDDVFGDHSSSAPDAPASDAAADSVRERLAAARRNMDEGDSN